MFALYSTRPIYLLYFTFIQLAYFLYQTLEQLNKVAINPTTYCASTCVLRRSIMVSTSSRWTATPLLILLLSSTTYAQYTLRGRIVQDHQKHSLDRRAEPAASPSESGTDQSGAGGDDGDTAGPEASSSTYSDKGDEGDNAPGDDDGDDGDDNATTVGPSPLMLGMSLMNRAIPTKAEAGITHFTWSAMKTFVSTVPPRQTPQSIVRAITSFRGVQR